jgi:hypothetical protein
MEPMEEENWECILWQTLERTVCPEGGNDQLWQRTEIKVQELARQSLASLMEPSQESAGSRVRLQWVQECIELRKWRQCE